MNLNQLKNWFQYQWIKCYCSCGNYQSQIRRWKRYLHKVPVWCKFYAKPNAYNLVLRDGLGDSFCILSFAKALAQKNHKKVFFLVKPSQEFMLHMFGYMDYVVLDMLKVKDLTSRYINQSPTPKIGEVFFAHPRYHASTEHLMSTSPCFVDVFKSLFLLPSRTPMEEPISFPKLSAKILQRVKQQGEKRIVLLCPETNSLWCNDKSWWKALAFHLQEKGFSVVCNVSKAENNIPRTENWHLSLSDTIALTQICWAVVSIRSGICDLCHKLGDRLIVFDVDFHTSDEKAFFNLNRMFPKCGVIEYLDNKKIPVDEIVSHIIHLGDKK